MNKRNSTGESKSKSDSADAKNEAKAFGFMYWVKLIGSTLAVFGFSLSAFGSLVYGVVLPIIFGRSVALRDVGLFIVAVFLVWLFYSKYSEYKDRYRKARSKEPTGIPWWVLPLILLGLPALFALI